MSETGGKNDSELNTAAHELFLLGQKTVEARAVLAALQQQLSDVSSRLVDTQQVEQVIEANQQLVVAILLAQSDAQSPPRLEEQRLYQELREANAQLVIAALSAQDLQATAERALGQQKSILAMVAHELRNPLTPISLIAERMVRLPSDQLPRMRELIEGQVQHISQLVDDLLDVSRVSTGKLRVERREVDMLHILRSAIDACGPVMRAKKQHFEAHLPDGPLTVSGDPGRLAQILNNLLANSAKYTPVGGRIVLSVTVADALRISIRDNGIGVSAKALPFIFDPYVQDEHAIGFNGSGLGIGLTVVRELVEAHDGTVAAMSEGKGKGSEFVVTLPLLNA
ncbi:sensor histidine kinase [Pseudomonas syringae]|jgi:signal transduction histidine kinase|uniref:histidine kinase n=1 Tax=Pseudomonas syringae TaxID=317 RepID=A0A9Q3ZYP6_PSESX|nr:sensor histidine kinase [Pseudomonas syringae]MCF5065381.1 sensor histidine kinase [Pseudomonas syringae]MCF5074006.1 sensor histidine kinase [Pseudomonas syringae]MCF5117345.1 sensor histidine kinase [Pseudomonas syringae]MCF5378846.1 sensor histidine kinase [Pseudomonas syringae]